MFQLIYFVIACILTFFYGEYVIWYVGQERPAKVAAVEIVSEDVEWGEFWQNSFVEHAAAFDAYFDAMEFRVSKNGRSMIRRPGDKSFRFVKAA
jgi:hypothetical protein